MMRHFDDQIRNIKLVSPFMHMPKAEMIALGQQRGISVYNSRSCYHSKEYHCGTGLVCRTRIAAFQAAKVEYLTVYMEVASSRQLSVI